MSCRIALKPGKNSIRDLKALLSFFNKVVRYHEMFWTVVSESSQSKFCLRLEKNYSHRSSFTFCLREMHCVKTKGFHGPRARGQIMNTICA